MAKTLYNQFDVVKFASSSSILTTNDHAKEYIGIVKEAGDMNSYIEWYDCKSKTATREVTNLTGWMNNIELTLVGSLFHMLTSKPAKTTTLASSVMTKPADNNNIVPEVRVKRKYTRREGAAKPGPKPKKDKAIAAAKPAEKKVVDTLIETDTTPKVVKVSTPIGRYKKPITKEQLKSSSNYCFATGKFKHFRTRQIMDQTIVDCGCRLYKHINGNLDFVIVGEDPGPSKMQKILWYGIPMISEEQWLALIGTPGYEFDPNVTNNACLTLPKKN